MNTKATESGEITLEGPSKGVAVPQCLVPAVVVGQLVGFVPGLGPLVGFAANRSGTPLAARSIIPLDSTHIGKQVTLVFEDSEVGKPIITGVMQDTATTVDDEVSGSLRGAAVVAQVDGKRVLLTAQEEIVLNCGKSSITLTKAGKVIIRGEYVLSRSSGANKIKGASVQIN